MASKRHIRRNKCDGKRKFDSEKSAKRAAIRVEKGKPLAVRRFVSAYRCEFCKKFHWGH